MTASTPRPPRLAELVIESLVSDADTLSATLGDMAEEFARVAKERSVWRAHDWYWTETVRSAPSLLWITLRGGVEPWVRLVASAVVGFYALASLQSGIELALLHSHPWRSPWGFYAVEMFLGLTGAVMVGYLVGVLGGATKLFVALLLGALYVGGFAWMVLGMGVGFEGPPGIFWWMRFLSVLPALMAGALAQSALRRRTIRVVEA